jgi:hypothetical protein
MMKYISVLVPFVFCTGLAAFFRFTAANPESVYGSPEMHDWLATLWFLIGIILGVLTLITLLIEDAFRCWDDYRERRRLSRDNKR